MTAEKGDYLLAVQAPAYRLVNGGFATESAFGKHLTELKASLGSRFSRVVLFAPQMSDSVYELSRGSLAVLSDAADGIVFVPAFPQSVGRLRFFTRHFLPMFRSIRTLVDGAEVVHSGMADDVWRPMMAVVNYIAKMRGRPVVFVVDIDFRKDSVRYRKLGLWKLKSFLVNRFIYDPIKWIQVWLAVRHFQLVLLKSQAMVDDFGRGRPNVKNFFDTVHREEDLLTEPELRLRLARVKETTRPLCAIYFGRLVPYKGVGKSVEAIAIARRRGVDARFKIIGAGECENDLRELVRRLNLEGFVTFHPPVPYGPELFAHIADADLSMATPLTEDTPRGAFDSMARGLPILAFDINYYRDLASLTGAVLTAEWPKAEGIGDKLCELAMNRARLADIGSKAVAFARQNTQPYWLRQRATWVFAMLGSSSKS